jgi:hypothetical protein
LVSQKSAAATEDGNGDYGQRQHREASAVAVAMNRDSLAGESDKCGPLPSRFPTHEN